MSTSTPKTGGRNVRVPARYISPRAFRRHAHPLGTVRTAGGNSSPALPRAAAKTGPKKKVNKALPPSIAALQSNDAAVAAAAPLIAVDDQEDYVSGAPPEDIALHALEEPSLMSAEERALDVEIQAIRREEEAQTLRENQATAARIREKQAELGILRQRLAPKGNFFTHAHTNQGTIPARPPHVYTNTIRMIPSYRGSPAPMAHPNLERDPVSDAAFYGGDAQTTAARVMEMDSAREGESGPFNWSANEGYGFSRGDYRLGSRTSTVASQHRAREIDAAIASLGYNPSTFGGDFIIPNWINPAAPEFCDPVVAHAALMEGEAELKSLTGTTSDQVNAASAANRKYILRCIRQTAIPVHKAISEILAMLHATERPSMAAIAETITGLNAIHALVQAQAKSDVGHIVCEQSTATIAHQYGNESAESFALLSSIQSRGDSSGSSFVQTLQRRDQLVALRICQNASKRGSGPAGSGHSSKASKTSTSGRATGQFYSYCQGCGNSNVRHSPTECRGQSRQGSRPSTSGNNSQGQSSTAPSAGGSGLAPAGVPPATSG